MEITSVNVFIWLSIILCSLASLISAYIVYRRNTKSPVHRYFAIFFIGLAGFVLTYLLLQDPFLKEFSYTLQLSSISIAVFGLFLFYYTLNNEGKAPLKVVTLCAIVLLLIPLLCVLLHPYLFIEESYGFELIIDLWFLILVNTIYLIFAAYAIIGLLWKAVKSNSQPLRRRLKLIFLGLSISLVSGILFFTIVPVFLNIHYLKPFGYCGWTIGTIVMACSFKGDINDTNNEEVE